jgi:hypothetical protein
VTKPEFVCIDYSLTPCASPLLFRVATFVKVPPDWLYHEAVTTMPFNEQVSAIVQKYGVSKARVERLNARISGSEGRPADGFRRLRIPSFAMEVKVSGGKFVTSAPVEHIQMPDKLTMRSLIACRGYDVDKDFNSVLWFNLGSVSALILW